MKKNVGTKIVDGWYWILDGWDWIAAKCSFIPEAFSNWDSQLFDFLDEGKYLLSKTVDFCYIGVGKIGELAKEMRDVFGEFIGAMQRGWK